MLRSISIYPSKWVDSRLCLLATMSAFAGKPMRPVTKKRRTPEEKRKERKSAILKRVGQTIAKKRDMAELTQGEVAKKLDIGEEAVSRMERGTASPDVFRLHELATLFKCGVDELVVESSQRPKDQSRRIVAMLRHLNSADRELVVEMIEKLCLRLREALPYSRRDLNTEQTKSRNSAAVEGGFLLTQDRSSAKSKREGPPVKASKNDFLL